MACAGRFTTYESREEHLPLVLIRKDAGPRPTITNLKTVLTSMLTGFKALTKETEKLIDKAYKLEKAEAAKKSKSKARPKVTAKKKIAAKSRPAVRGPVKRRAWLKVTAKKKAPAKKVATGKARELPDAATVLKIIKRHKRGVDISKLKDRTGFDDTKIRNIISKAYGEGKIRRVGRGVYSAA